MYNLLSTFPQNIHVWILDIKIGFASKNNQWTNGQWKMWNLTSDMVLMWSGHSFWPASEWYLQGAGVRVEKKSGIRGQVEFWDFVFSFFFQYGLGWNTVPKELFRISQLKQSHLWILGVFFQKKKWHPLKNKYRLAGLEFHVGSAIILGVVTWYPLNDSRCVVMAVGHGFDKKMLIFSKILGFYYGERMEVGLEILRNHLHFWLPQILNACQKWSSEQTIFRFQIRPQHLFDLTRDSTFQNIW